MRDEMEAIPGAMQFADVAADDVWQENAVAAHAAFYADRSCSHKWYNLEMRS